MNTRKKVPGLDRTVLGEHRAFMSPMWSCPRCGTALNDSGAARPRCPIHGPVLPMHAPQAADDSVIAQVTTYAQVPLWLPWPVPLNWAVTGVRWTGRADDGAVATALALTGPNLLALDLDDPPAAEVIVVAEQPGVGMAAHLAGLAAVDVGDRVGHTAPDLHLVAGGHQTPLWSFAVGNDGHPEGVAFVGEAAGVWLWVLAWPSGAAALLLGQIGLVDLRSPDHQYLLPYGPLSTRLHRQSAA